jgi:hypothetical protein
MAKKVSLTVEQVKQSAKNRHGHAKGCKKPLDDCKHCQENIRFFAELPPQLLNEVLK